MRKSVQALIAGVSMLAVGAATTIPNKAEAFPWVIAGVAVTVGVLGGILLTRHASAAPGFVAMKYKDDGRMGYRSDNAMGKCAAKYKSFNPNTGMVRSDQGVKPCPYLH